MAKATLSQYLQIGAMIDAGSLDRKLAQALIEGRIEVAAAPTKSGSGTTYKIPASYALRPKTELEQEFDCVSDLFDGRPWERHSSCVTIDETAGERTLHLAEVPEQFLKRKIENCLNELAAHFDKQGKRFAIEVEAIAFAKAHPDLQRKHWILALGSSTLAGRGDRCVAYLREFDGGRGLRDCWVVNVLDRDGRLLLVSK